MARVAFTLSSLARRIVPPVLPPLPTTYKVDTGVIQKVDLNPGTNVIEGQIFPLGLRLDTEGDFWQLPIEPFISLSGSNTIIRRNIAKTGTSLDVRGTIKERWSQDDYRITINGVLRNIDNPNEYPKDTVERLRTYCEAKQALRVSSPIFECFNIAQMVIESYEIPFTRGEDLQAYTITAYSDALFELLIDMENV